MKVFLEKNINKLHNLFFNQLGRVAGAGRSRCFWLEPELKFSPCSGSYSYSTVLKIFCFTGPDNDYDYDYDCGYDNDDYDNDDYE